jgi:hypothetical protein
MLIENRRPPGRGKRFGSGWEAFRKRSVSALPGMTHPTIATSARTASDFRRARSDPDTEPVVLVSSLARRLDGEFRSGEPERVWAAACSVARVMCARELWVDSTAVHEAAWGAWDAVTDPEWLGFDRPVPGALAGARRSLLLERVARGSVFRPGPRSAARLDREVGWWGRLVELDEVADLEHPTGFASEVERPHWIEWLATALADAGWRWPLPPLEGLQVALDAVVDVGRERAAPVVAGMVPQLPSASAAGLVTLIAGSRQRDPRPWPGVVWLVEHHGLAGAAQDPGVAGAVDAVVAGSRCFPSRARGAAVHHAGRRPLTVTPFAGRTGVGRW